ncbi:hypothetical protein Dbac_2316 [Desulfomicrobium baculatum DSM 4028]|uniref:Uncharacterized protein n=1 Tax=Desulfomicrobium baculatum (strain DSM 4028 / VKM B-1378 / X) TaxID=525897 RepID=C7LQJ5_DESBD|nr:hypothetical protein Dbac_2316 [Desulfomicrobium baculatum DSM 4028]
MEWHTDQEIYETIDVTIEMGGGQAVGIRNQKIFLRKENKNQLSPTFQKFDTLKYSYLNLFSLYKKIHTKDDNLTDIN